TDMHIGTAIHNIEITLENGGQLVRAASSVAKLIAKEGKCATLKLPSGEVRLVSKNCPATVVEVGNVGANCTYWLSSSNAPVGSSLSQKPINRTKGNCSCLLTLLLTKTSAEIMLLLISLKSTSADLSKPINTLSFHHIKALSFDLFKRHRFIAVIRYQLLNVFKFRLLIPSGILIRRRLDLSKRCRFAILTKNTLTLIFLCSKLKHADCSQGMYLLNISENKPTTDCIPSADFQRIPQLLNFIPKDQLLNSNGYTTC
ncbi:hypothetical protein F511_04126, partial [Dorcoceras hygrometricum]